jgi:hypothetical protein
MIEDSFNFLRNIEDSFNKIKGNGTDTAYVGCSRPGLFVEILGAAPNKIPKTHHMCSGRELMA